MKHIRQTCARGDYFTIQIQLLHIFLHSALATDFLPFHSVIIVREFVSPQEFLCVISAGT